MDSNRKYIKPGVVLFENQKYNIKNLIHRRRCILSDRCGGGKSLSVLYAFSLLKEKAILNNLVVLTPLSAYEKEVWKKDIQKFTNLTSIDIEKLVSLVDDNPLRLERALQNYDVIYCKHTHLKQDKALALLRNLSAIDRTLICVDEIHAFRNPKSNLTLLLRDLTKNVKAFWGITATTISRNIENLYNIVNLVYPWYLGTWSMFRDTYCNTMLRTIGYDRILNKKRQTIEATSIKDPIGLRNKLAPILITGESFVKVKYTYIDYSLNDYEQGIYTKIARGISLEAEKDPEEWFKMIISDDFLEPKKVKSIGDVDRYSSRFIYLQHAADGIIEKDGSYSRVGSTKVNLLISKLKEIVAKKQSVLVYFDYLAPVTIVKSLIEKEIGNCTVLLSTGEDKLKEGLLTEAKCKIKSHIVLCTRAASESASYYFINNVIFFHNPTVPSTFIQMLGRITRKNTLYPDDLNCYIFRSNNVDLYKLLIVSGKTRLMEVASGEYEENVPDDYKELMDKSEATAKYRKILLWQD